MITKVSCYDFKTIAQVDISIQEIMKTPNGVTTAVLMRLLTTLECFVGSFFFLFHIFPYVD